MKTSSSLLCFMLCVLAVSTVEASMAVNTTPVPTGAPTKSGYHFTFPQSFVKALLQPDSGEVSGSGAGQGHKRDGATEEQYSLSPSLVMETLSVLRTARTMKAADDGETGADTGNADSVPVAGISMSQQALSLFEIAASVRPGGGFFFESPDASGAGIKVATISPVSPAIRMLSPYQADDTDKPVPLPPAAMLFGSGLAFCFAVRRKLLRHDRLVSPTR